MKKYLSIFLTVLAVLLVILASCVGDDPAPTDTVETTAATDPEATRDPETTQEVTEAPDTDPETEAAAIAAHFGAAAYDNA